MKTLFFFVACCASVCSSISLPTLSARQANSQIAASAFRRRAYHSSIVLDNFVYIDGGEFSYSSGNSITLQYSSTLLSIDLSKDWTNSTVPFQSVSKPSGVPDLVDGGIWVDRKKSMLYTGFAGRQSFFGNNASQPYGLWSFKPDGTGSGTWTNMNKTADTSFQTQPRPFSPNVASGGGAGYMLGGFTPDASDIFSRSIPSSGLITYNMTTKKYTNTTVSDSTKGVTQMGALQYIDVFGSEGILVGFGGDQYGAQETDSDSLLSMSTVQVFDVASGKWYDQTVSGNVPEMRKEFCVTGLASNNDTYEIFMYAGWNGHLGPTAIPYDEVYVLTLPGFYWVKASYNALNPRHGLSCNSVGGGQILTIGGVNTTQNGPENLYDDVFNTADQKTEGLAVFDLETMAWKNSFTANKNIYTPSAQIQSFYASNSRKPTFDNAGLSSVFAIENFGNSSNGTSSSSGSGSTTGSHAKKKSNHTGAIVGGIIGGIAALVIIVAIMIFFLRRRETKARTAPMHELPGQDTQKNEMNGEGHLNEMDANQNMDQSGGVPYSSTPGKPYKYSPIELPGGAEQRHEMA